MSFVHSSMTPQLKGFAIGSSIGLAVAIPLFLTVPAYHNFIMWQFAHPALFLIALPLGYLVAVLTD